MKKILNKENFINKSALTLEGMLKTLEQTKELEVKNLNTEKSMVLSIDLNNGFAKKGALYSPRVEELIKPTQAAITKLVEMGLPFVAFTDTHTEQSPELIAYPEHCMIGTVEQKVVDELLEIPNIVVKPKNSTNGFLAYNILNQKEMEYPNLSQEDLDKKDTFIITGDCTDICIYQFAITLKTYLNQHNKEGRVIVVMDLVDTYDAPWHNADLLNVVFLNSMISNGVEVVKNLKF